MTWIADERALICCVTASRRALICQASPKPSSTASPSFYTIGRARPWTSRQRSSDITKLLHWTVETAVESRHYQRSAPPSSPERPLPV